MMGKKYKNDRNRMDLNYPIVFYLYFFFSFRKNRNGNQEKYKNDRGRMNSNYPIVR